MGGDHEFGTSAKDWVELGTRATNEKISGVSERLGLVEESVTSIRSSLAGAKEKMEGFDQRLKHVEEQIRGTSAEVNLLQKAVNKEAGYKEGLKDGFKVLHILTGLACTAIGGLLVFLLEHFFKS